MNLLKMVVKTSIRTDDQARNFHTTVLDILQRLSDSVGTAIQAVREHPTWREALINFQELVDEFHVGAGLAPTTVKQMQKLSRVLRDQLKSDKWKAAVQAVFDTLVPSVVGAGARKLINAFGL